MRFRPSRRRRDPFGQARLQVKSRDVCDRGGVGRTVVPEFSVSDPGVAVTADDKPSIVFAHGLWADGSCFARVIGELQAEGYEAISSGYGLESLDGDVAATVGALGRVTNPSLLVGHSYGGSVITVAGADARVAGLVFMAAFAPAVGETSMTQLSNFPTPEVFSDVEVEDGRIWMFPEGVESYAGDLSAQDKAVVWATHRAPAFGVLEAEVRTAAWKTKPSWYLVASEDRCVQPDLQRFFAARMRATTYEVESSHMLMLSHPELVIDVIRQAAAALQGPSSRSGIVA
jgi:pimeloyl-ACP methyl ester carboxylesterase